MTAAVASTRTGFGSGIGGRSGAATRGQAVSTLMLWPNSSTNSEMSSALASACSLERAALRIVAVAAGIGGGVAQLHHGRAEVAMASGWTSSLSHLSSATATGAVDRGRRHNDDLRIAADRADEDRRRRAAHALLDRRQRLVFERDRRRAARRISPWRLRSERAPRHGPGCAPRRRRAWLQTLA